MQISRKPNGSVNFDFMAESAIALSAVGTDEFSVVTMPRLAAQIAECSELSADDRVKLLNLAKGKLRKMSVRGIGRGARRLGPCAWDVSLHLVTRKLEMWNEVKANPTLAAGIPSLDATIEALDQAVMSVLTQWAADENEFDM